MSIAQSMLPEWDHEARNTKRALERVREEHFDYRPHEKSSSLIELASHIANQPAWVGTILTTDELDIAGMSRGRPHESAEALMRALDDNVAAARRAIEACSDEQFRQPWTLKRSGTVMFAMPRVATLRGFVMNHIIHHRGQLTVYLRLVGAKVPGLYGASADDAM